MKCFADNISHCKVLKKKDCEDCSFFKTQEQLDESNRKSKERLKRIGRVE